MKIKLRTHNKILEDTSYQGKQTKMSRFRFKIKPRKIPVAIILAQVRQELVEIGIL